jgi:O-6-methylguanine DNA methyltransferase
MMKQQVLEYISTIPAGKVVTYGQIAAAVGHPGAARAVGNILHCNPDPERYPCHRVVSASGKLAENFAFGGVEGQARKLRAEGVAVTDGKVDLKRYGWLG